VATGVDSEMNSGAEPLEQAGQRLDRLERECETLGEALQGKRTQVEGLRADLDLLRQGIFPRRGWPLLAIFISVVLAGGVGGALVWRGARRASESWPQQQAAAQLPHLLVTSEPDGADIVLDGVPRGRTPLLLSLPARAAEMWVALSAPGYRQATVQAKIEAERGAHVHGRLHPAP
jgi:hypothetical protein